jgi:hypothetical protein
MRKPFLAFLVFYLVTFLFFQEEIHGFSHHLKEVNHLHSLKCFFGSGEERKLGITETCHFHDLFIKDSVSGINFFSSLTPQLLNVTYFFPEMVAISENFIFFLPASRAPPIIS